MTAVAWFLSAILVLEQTPPADAAKCSPTDNRCKAALFVKRAKAADTPQRRALYFHAAHRSYLALFDQTGDARHLCAARRTFDQSLAVAEQPDAQRASFEALRGELVSRERSIGAGCGTKAARPTKSERPLVAAKTGRGAPASAPLVTKAESPRVAPVESASSMVALAPQSEPPLPESALLPTSPTTALTSEPVLPIDLTPTQVSPPDPATPVTVHGGGVATSATQPAGALRPVTPQPPRSTASMMRRPGRDMVIVGSAALGAGLVLAGAAGYLGHGLLETKRAASSLHNMAVGDPTDEQRAEDLALWREYRRNGPPTLALALAGGASVIVAAILLGIGGKRMARAASHTALIPLPGGLAVRAKF